VYTDYEMARQCGAFFIGVPSEEATRADYEGLPNIAIFPTVADVFGPRTDDGSPDGVLSAAADASVAG